jgi:predicted DNA-binding protein
MYDPYIMKRTQIYLESGQDRRLAARARAAGTTKSTLIREAVERYLATPDEDGRLAAFRDAVQAVASSPVAMPDGATYVEALRAADRDHDADLERRRRG